MPGDGHLLLRPWTLDDVEWVVAACQDPEISRWTRVPSPYGRDEAVEFIDHATAARADASELHYVIEEPGSIGERRVTGEAGRPETRVGAIGLVGVDGSEAEGGYWVAADARGRGVATAALEILVEHAFADLGLSRVWLEILHGNTGSERAAVAAGFAAVETRPAQGCGQPGDLVTVFERRLDGPS